MSKAMGGDFMSGALAAGFSELAGPMVDGLGPVGEGVARMVVGGTASVIGGGKFENGAITAAYGYSFNKSLHRNRKVYAARDGEVNWADWENPKNTRQGYGFNVQITSQDGTTDVYAHMQPDSIVVQVGDNVHAGDYIGKYADPGNGAIKGPHLHFERIDKNGEMVQIKVRDVLNVIPGGVVTSQYGMRWHPVKHIWKLHEGIDKVGPLE